MKFTKVKEEKLKACAKAVANNSYSPYSKFKVGAAVLADSGKIYTGTNVENASFGLTICAERAAIFAGIAAGETGFVSLCIYTPTKKPTLPCGACLQVMGEMVSQEGIESSRFECISNPLGAGSFYLIGTCKKGTQYSGFLSEMYNGKFTDERFKL